MFSQPLKVIGYYTVAGVTLTLATCAAVLIMGGVLSGCMDIGSRENAVHADILQARGPGTGHGNRRDPGLAASPSTALLSGNVDSSLIDREGRNQVYVFVGSVEPDDIDGGGGDPIVTIPVVQHPGRCTWGYWLDALALGEYTLAFTTEAANDAPRRDDSISFIGAARVTVRESPGGVTHDFATAGILRVGPGRALLTPSDASTVAQDGDVIEIDAGIYKDDIAVWRQDNLTLRGVGGRAHLRATRIIPFGSDDQQNGKGIWVTQGAKIAVENVEMSGAKVADQNGAGIRGEGDGLTICNSYFHDNENGVLAGGGNILIEYSEFAHNGLSEDGQTHNVYVNSGERLTFRYNYSHHALIGHNLKTRARQNYILYNRIMDEADGRSSYAIDVPNGGLTFLIGNLIQQGPDTENPTMVSYGAEALEVGRVDHLYLVNNTLVNDHSGGTFVTINPNTQRAELINNLLVGEANILSGASNYIDHNNLQTTRPGLVDAAEYNYRLTRSSSARDAGHSLGVGDGFSLRPISQYVHKARQAARPTDATLDIGAYEFQP